MSPLDWFMAILGAVGMVGLIYWGVDLYCDTHPVNSAKCHPSDDALMHQGGEDSALVIYPEVEAR